MLFRSLTRWGTIHEKYPVMMSVSDRKCRMVPQRVRKTKARMADDTKKCPPGAGSSVRTFALAAGGILLLLAIVVAALTSRGRDQVRKAAEAARNKEQAREAAKVTVEAQRLQRCKEIVASLQGQKLTANDESWLGPSGDLAKRIQAGTLTARDLATQRANFQCGEPLFNLLVPLAANTANLWAGISSVAEVSQDLTNALSGQAAVALLGPAIGLHSSDLHPPRGCGA